MLTFPCPCGVQLQIAESSAATAVKCPRCGKDVSVPRLQAARSSGASVGGPTANLTVESAPPVLESPPTKSSAPSGLAGETLGPPENRPAESLTAFLAPAQRADEIGRLGDYRILKVLGHGGMGVVFLAEDPKLHRKVAIKAMLPDLAASASARQRFLREAQAAAALEHDHIVPILHIGEDHGVPYIVMPFLKGESLEERLKLDGPMPAALVVQIGLQVANALEAAHSLGLLHRDIKPGNIWLEVRGPESGGAPRVKLLDFGLARLTQAEEGEHLTRSGAILGTPGYMAPEQIDGLQLDGRADLFSLGCVLYRMATGKPAFNGPTVTARLLAVARDTPAAPETINQTLPPPLSEIIMKLLAKDRANRPTSASDVATALRTADVEPNRERVHADADMTYSPGQQQRLADAASQVESTVDAADTPRRRGLFLAVAVLGAALLAVAGIVLFWSTPNGLVRIEINDPAVKVAIDREEFRISGIGKHDLKLSPGKHALRVRHGNFDFETDKFILGKGETVTLKIEVLQGKVHVLHDGKLIGTNDAPLAKVDDKAPPAVGPDRRAALWALSLGGTVTIEE